MPHDPLTAEQREIRELVRTLARERIAPRAAEIDRSAEFPWDVVELFRENGLFGLMFDEEYGGVGASALMTLVTIEEVVEGLRDERADPRRAGARRARDQARGHATSRSSASCRGSRRASGSPPTR